MKTTEISDDTSGNISEAEIIRLRKKEKIEGEIASLKHLGLKPWVKINFWPGNAEALAKKVSSEKGFSKDNSLISIAEYSFKPEETFEKTLADVKVEFFFLESTCDPDYNNYSCNCKHTYAVFARLTDKNRQAIRENEISID